MATIEMPKIAIHGSFPWLNPTTLAHAMEYIPTFCTEFAVMLSQILAYKLAAHYLGKEGFSEYALARRTISLLIPIPMLGLTVGLPRYIGYSNGRGDFEGADRHFGATMWCVGGGALICISLMNIFSGAFGYLFFGNRSYGSLALAFGLMILGLCVHTVVCGYFRGHMRLNRANLMQLANLAVAPISVFVVFRHSLNSALTALGLIWIVISGVGLFFTPWDSIIGDNTKEVKELLPYGIQRVPGDFVLMALFTLPSTFVAHLRGVQEAGFVAFGISVVAMIGAMFAPLGLVLLPKATLMFAEGAKSELRKHLWLLLKATLVASFLMTLVIWIWIPSLVHLYLGVGYEQVVPIVRLVVLAALPYSLYLVFRNLVDAYHEYGITAAILTGALALFLAASYLSTYWRPTASGILIAFYLAQVAIAALSGLECRRILRG